MKMNMKKILWVTVCCGAVALSAAEGRFTLQSPDLRHGFASNHLLSASYGFGWRRRQRIARADLAKSARRHQKLCADGL